jgi:fumarylpyruvate hydrolase
VRGTRERLPINRLFFVGRNYHAHAVEMGAGRQVGRGAVLLHQVAATLVESGATVAYPPAPGTTTTRWNWWWRSASRAFASPRRRARADLRLRLRPGHDAPRPAARRARQGPPWDLGKDVEKSSVVSRDRADAGVVLEQGELAMTVNGQPRQKSDLSKLIWNIRELIADLSSSITCSPAT